MTTNCYFVTTKCYYIQIVVTNSHKSVKFKSISGGTVNLTFILFNLFKCEIFQRSADLLTCENDSKYPVEMRDSPVYICNKVKDMCIYRYFIHRGQHSKTNFIQEYWLLWLKFWTVIQKGPEGLILLCCMSIATHEFFHLVVRSPRNLNSLLLSSGVRPLRQNGWYWLPGMVVMKIYR